MRRIANVGQQAFNSAADQKGVLGKPGYRFQSKMTPSELEEHRAKGLCFFCHERFTPGHHCAQRQKAQVFFMEVEDAIVGVGELHVQEKIIDPEEGQEPVTVTLNSIFGNAHNPSNTMRIKGSHGSRVLHILIDTGSSHNFLSNMFLKGGVIKFKNINPLQVTFADRWQVQGSQLVENFHWSMQGHNFNTCYSFSFGRL